jgi:3',5'-cyclic AMP phosphodiesterase CpdA
MKKMDRRDFIKLAGLGGGVVFASGLGLMPRLTKAAAQMTGDAAKDEDFFFVQLSDTHWGYEGAKANPHADITLKKAVDAVNALAEQPDFIVFTGDLTHTTEDPKLRRQRMKTFKEIVSELKVKDVKFLAGEHDASLDNGEAYHEFFGKSYYSFNHKGFYFIALDNVSDPTGSVGDVQLAWLADELKKIDQDAPIVVLTHRPLFDLYPQWDWATKDGAKVMSLLMPFKHVTVFYGHIHQEHHQMTEHIAHHATKSLIFPLPAPGSVPKRAAIPWDAAQPYNGLGFRNIKAEPDEKYVNMKELPIKE